MTTAFLQPDCSHIARDVQVQLRDMEQALNTLKKELLHFQCDSSSGGASPVGSELLRKDFCENGPFWEKSSC